MPIVNLSLGDTRINASCKAGDVLYYIKANTLVGGFNTHLNNADMIEIGPIKEITTSDNMPGDANVEMGWIIICYHEENTILPETGDFLFFAKNRAVNEASIVGYYGKFKFKNNSRDKAELFATACEVLESSK